MKPILLRLSATCVISLVALTSLISCRTSETAALTDAEVISTAQLATVLGDPTASKPHLIHVGFVALYGAKHIPASVYAGPGAEAAGIEKLKSAVGSLPKDADIVLYCGCCPWANCPNVRPAFATLKAGGFTNVRVLMIDENMQKDWIDKGYPIE